MTVKKAIDETGDRHSGTPGDAHAAILAAARRRIAGGEELSISAVAAEAGVSRQTVHARFGGARGLRAALAAEGLIQLAPEDAMSTRDRLIEAAVRLLSRPGGAFISIEAIAAEAGLTKGAVYHHFTDRAEILRAVARRVSPVDEMKARITPSAELSPRDGLIAIATAYYAAMSARADLIRNLASNSARDPELTSIVMNEIVVQGAPLLLAWFGAQIAAGKLRPVDPTFVIQALFGPVFLLIVLGPEVLDRIAVAGIHPAIANVEAYVDMLLAGIAPADQTNGGN